MKCLFCNKIDIVSPAYACDSCQEHKNKYYTFKEELKELCEKHGVTEISAEMKYDYYGSGSPTIEVVLDGFTHNDHDLL